MSHCEIIEFRGDVQTPHKFHNAWGGSARIFKSMFEAYIPITQQYQTWSTFPQKLWDLAYSVDVPAGQRAVLASTFDKAYVKQADFARFAEDLRVFGRMFPAPPGAVDHLFAWATLIEQSTAHRVGFMGTSVSGSTWTIRVECPHCGSTTDESRDYAFGSDTGAIDVYDDVLGEGAAKEPSV
jgi:hypothetical protein